MIMVQITRLQGTARVIIMQIQRDYWEKLKTEIETDPGQGFCGKIWRR